MGNIARPKEQNIRRTFSGRESISLKWILFLLFLPALTACKSNQHSGEKLPPEHEYSWKRIKSGETDSAEWFIYSRKVKGSAFKAFKISGGIQVSPARAVEALRYKMEHSAEFISENEGFIQILYNTPSESLIYSVYRLPFPFRDRAMCERFLFSEHRETGIHKITWQEDWSTAPPQRKDVVRMPVARGSWEFAPDGPGRSIATYIVHAEPGGIIPAWMVNATVRKGLPDELRSVEEIAKSLQ